MKNPLAKYNFTDDHGHHIESCTDYHSLLDDAACANTLQDLYDSEINCSISCFWDGGWQFKLGDEMNGFCAVSYCATFKEGVNWLTEQALIHYPDSVFAKVYRP